MKKIFNALEKRIFIAYFFVTFLLVLVLILIEWQLVRYSIRQYENENMQKAINQLKLTQSELAARTFFHLVKLSENEQFKEALLKKDQESLIDLLEARSIMIYDNSQKIIAGVDWDFVNNYINDIFQQKREGYFLANFGSKLFYIFYLPIYQNEELLAYLIEPQMFILPNLAVDTSIQISYSILPISSPFSDNNLKNFRKTIEKEIAELANNIKSSSLINLSMSQALGISIDYDINNKAIAVFFLNYEREINSFAQQSIVLFVLILMAITLFMISLVGNWFTRTILHPVKIISDRMLEITQEPSIIKPIETKYSGVLGDLVDTFNSMNYSLNEYSKSLLEYKIITENLNSGIFWLNEEFEVIFCNSALLNIFELQNIDEIIEKNLNNFLKLDEKIIRKSYEENVVLSNLEIEVKNKNKYVTLNTRNIPDETELIIVGSITDITSEIIEKKAREALELELIKSNRLAEIGRRVEGIIHNMNSPLNSILGYAQLLKKEHKVNKDIDRIIDSGKVISHYVKSLQQKIKSDNISMRHPVNINELIDKELELCQHNLFFKHYIKLKKNLSENLPEIYAVHGDISLCIANFLNNAIESLKNSEKKVITVTTFLNNNMLCISIKDTGIGIEKTNLDKIFEPYFTTKQENDASGFGLGLAISKHVIDKYKGKIDVKSSVERGSEFILSLPLEYSENIKIRQNEEL